MKEIMTINVDIKMITSIKYDNKTLQVIHFSGNAKGDFFIGHILEQGLDTQIIESDHMTLSARYILEGYDYTGNLCKVFIENEGTMNQLVPKIHTDSPSLAFLNQANLTSTLKETQSGVVVKIWQMLN
jgi:hypothetical protein